MTSTRFSREERKRAQMSSVFWWELKHNRIFFAFYTFFMMLSLPVSLLVSILSHQEYYNDPTNWTEARWTSEKILEAYSKAVQGDFVSLLEGLAIPLTFMFMLCLCFNTFGYMHNRRSVDLYHAFPIRRKPMLMGGLLAVLVTLLLPLAAAVGACQVVCKVYGMTAPITPALFWNGYGVMALLFTASLVFILFFIVMSGTQLNAALNLIAVALGYPVVMIIINLTMAMFLPGYVSVVPLLLYTLFCPFAAVYQVFGGNIVNDLVGSLVGTYDYTATFEYNIPPSYLIWWIAFTLVFLILTVICYDKRRSETAENNQTYLLFRSVVSVLMCLGGGLGLAGIWGSIMNSNKFYLVGLVLGLVITHVVYNVVMNRGFKGFVQTIPAFLVSSALLVGGIYALYTGGLGYATRIPTAENVAKVEVTIPNTAADTSVKGYWAEVIDLEMYVENTEYPEEGDMYLGSLQPTITKTNDIGLVCALHSEVLTKFTAPYKPFKHSRVKYTGYYNFSVKYTLVDGSTLVRRYDVPIYSEDTALLKALAAIQSCDSYQVYSLKDSLSSDLITNAGVNYYSPRENYNADNYKLTAEEKEQVWTTFLEELNSPDFHNDTTFYSYEEAKQRETPDYQEPDSTSWSYYIEVGSIPWSNLSPELQAIITQYCTDTEITTPLTSVSGYSSYSVPDCCTKTRELIYQFTEKNGSHTYYDENGNEVDANGNIIDYDTDDEVIDFADEPY